MQIGFQAVGIKDEVITSIQDQAAKQLEKFDKNCKSHSVAIYGANGLEGHKNVPITNLTSDQLVSAALSFANEHLAHCNSEDEVSVFFQVTVSRPNTK